jgi:hypothetical protein
MPQEPVIVYSVEDGKPIRMHSVDADEAVRLGDYTRTPPGGKDPDPAQLSAAALAMRGLGGPIHPELQTPEERAETRRQANEAAAAAAVAAGQPVPAAVAAAAAPAPAPASTERSSARTPPRHTEPSA